MTIHSNIPMRKHNTRLSLTEFKGCREFYNGLRLLRHGRSIPEKQQDELQEGTSLRHNAISFGLCLGLAMAMLIGGCIVSKPAHAMTADQWSKLAELHKNCPDYRDIGNGCEKGAEINLSIIADIESSGNPLAYNNQSGATGMYQITKGVVYDYNHSVSGSQYTLEDMYEPAWAVIIANWFLNTRIPLWLNNYGIPDTVTSRLIAYNWGIGHLHKWFKHGSQWNRLPNETKKYVKRYYREMKGDD